MNAKELAKRLHEVFKSAPVGSDVFELLAKECESYHRAKVEAVTDEEIEKESFNNMDEMGGYGFRRGAKWLRNKLLNQ